MKRPDEPPLTGFLWIFAGAILLALGLTVVATRVFHRLPSHPRPPAAIPAARSPTVASLTPAATDIVVGIGAAGHLVAVSDYDDLRDATASLPRVGDFDRIDWEKLAELHPDILLTQFGDRMPTAVQDRCGNLGIRVIDVKLNVLEDIYRQADVLGEALNEVEGEQLALASLRRRLRQVADQTASLPKIRTAIVDIDGTDIGLIGPDTFHDQILQRAGGENVAESFNKRYITADREQLAQLAPDVILLMQPTPPTSPQQARQEMKLFESMPDVPAVKNGQVIPITDSWCERPGWHVADLAEEFERKLHPEAVH